MLRHLIVLLTPLAMLFAAEFRPVAPPHCGSYPVTWIQPTGISSDNTIVGHFLDETGKAHGFHLKAKQCAVVDYPGATNTFAWGINRHGHISGYFYDAGGGVHGFLRRDGAFAEVTYIAPAEQGGPRPTFLYGLNNRGQAVGVYYQGSLATAFVHENGQFRTFSVPEASRTAAYGINNAGAIVGAYQVRGREGYTRGFILWDVAKLRFDLLAHPRGQAATVLWSINDDEEIVGQYFDAQANSKGFLWSNGSFNRLQYPGATGLSTAPYGINRSGYVVGQYGPSGVFLEQRFGFFWTWE